MLKPFQEGEDRIFDEQFGKAGPERNSDSIGRSAGCDDCSTNIELREEVKQWIKDHDSRLLALIIKKIEGMEVSIPEGVKFAPEYLTEIIKINGIIDKIITHLTEDKSI